MALLAKLPASKAKPGDLGFILRTHMVEEENQQPRVVL